MTIVTVHGDLGRIVGETWELLISKPREAIAAIEANTGKLYAYLRAHSEIEYRVLINGKDHSCVEELYLGGRIETIDIIPVPSGAGGLWQAIIGVVLIIVGVVLSVTGYGTAIAPYAITAGLGMLAGGVAAMLTPTPKLGASPFARSFRPMTEQLQQEKKAPEHTPSYLFSGAVNTTAQGNPVPIIYGTMLVGSQIGSMAITSSTIHEALIGAEKAPKPADEFFDLPVWPRIEAAFAGNLINRKNEVRGLKVAEVEAARLLYGIPANDPVTAKPIPTGSIFMPRKTFRGYLKTVSAIVNNYPRGITFNEALDLYRVLSLTSLSEPERATWKQVVNALAIHYSPEP